MKNLNWLMSAPIAHRGLHDRARPENSLAAIDAAAARGFAMEIDVQASADGEVVVFHDWTLEKFCRRGEAVDELTAAALSRIAILDSDQTIPTLAEVLALVAGRVPIIVEIKNAGRAPGAFEEKIDRLLQAYGGQVAVLSFSPQVVAWFARHSPELIRGWNGKRHPRHKNYIPALERFRRSHFIDNDGADPDFYGYDQHDLPYWPVARLRQAGKPVLAFTIKSMEEKNRIVDHADGIFFEGFEP